MSNLSSKSVIGWIIAAVVVFGAAPAAAFRPSPLTGIDLSTVLTVRERARSIAFRLDRNKSAADSLDQIHTVVLDPGHGGDNLGARGVADVCEKYLTLELAYEVRDRLQAKYPDLDVILTRYWDQSMSLTERVHFANLMSADLFLSLHYNAATHNRAVGFETYFLKASAVTPGETETRGAPIATAKNVVTGIKTADHRRKDGIYNDALVDLKRDLNRQRRHRDSGLLAEIVQHDLREHLDSVDRGVKQANFGVLRGALMPAVVVESGFLTHPEEGRAVLTDDHRARVAAALLEAVEQFDAKLTDRVHAR